jgi:hypothetical protein
VSRVPINVCIEALKNGLCGIWKLECGSRIKKNDPSFKFYNGSCFHTNLTFFPEIVGVKLSDASKKLGKKFATGASVVKVSVIFCDSVLAFDSFEALSRHIFILFLRVQLRRSKLMCKGTYHMTLWSSLQIHGMM